MEGVSTDSPSANKDVIRRFLAALDGGEVSAYRELMSPNLVVHFPGTQLDRQQTEATIGAFYTAFPDLTHTIEDLIAIEDKVVARLTDRGTHGGNFQGIAATGRAVEFGVIAIYRVVNGLITEVWEEGDLLGLMRQLGVEVPGT